MNARSASSGLAFLLFAGLAYAHHCADGYWLGSGGGYVGAYVEQKWTDCVAVGRKASWEEWVGAQYGCVGTYYKRGSTTQTVYVRIYRCVKTSATAGYCTWADAPEGSPSGHSDNITSNHSCPACTADNRYWNGAACVMGNGDGSNLGSPSCPSAHEGNPIHARTGNKYQHEVDYVGRGPFPLRFERHYNSFVGKTPSNWRHSYDRRLKVNNYGVFGQSPYQWIVDTAKVLIVRPDGRELNFSATVDASTNYQLSAGTFFTAAPYVTERLEKVATGFKLYTSDDGVEMYDSAGRLLSIADRQGRLQELEYDGNGRLGVVRDPVGNELLLTYTSQGLLLTMTDPAGGLHQYVHDASTRLSSVTYPDNTTRTYLYTNGTYPHLLTGIVDENGVQFATFTYSAQGRATTSTHAGDVNKVALAFNADGTTTVTDALGTARVRSFANAFGLYRSAGSTVPCTSCGNTSEAMTYDANGFMDARTDFNGNVTDYTFNSRGLEEARAEAAQNAQLARTVTTQWHPSFRLPVQVDEPGRRTTYTYDATGKRLSQSVIELATGRTRATTWTYDGLGQVLTANGPRTDVADITGYTYYECATGAECGQVHTVTNALGHVTTITSYDGHGNPLALVDPNGVVTTLTYDLRQRLKSRAVAGATTTFDHDNAGQLTKVTLPGGSYLSYTYDAAHRLTSIQDNDGNRIQYTLDLLGNRTKEEVFDPAGVLKRRHSQVFNGLGRLFQTRDASGAVVTEYGYDDQGNRVNDIAHGDASAVFATSNEFDALNRLWRSTAPDGGVTQYGYNALDQLISVTDPKGLVTGYTLNALGDLEQLASPDTGVTTYTHDAAGNRTAQTDARGVEVAYSHDALGRLTFVDYPGSDEDVAYSYDSTAQSYGKGRLTGIIDAAGATTLSYDARGNVTSEQRVIAGVMYTTGYGYDSADRLATITYPSGRVVTYTRNSIGQVTTVSTTVGGNTTTLAQDIAYLPFGGVKEYTLGNGVAVTRGYDLDYRLQEVIDAATGPIQHLAFDYDRRGNVTLRDDLVAAVPQTFGYDAMSRLNSASGAYGTQGFTYDDVGNRLTQTGTTPDTYTYPGNSHRLSSTGSGTLFTYDDAGNASTKGLLVMTYNQAGRLATASVGLATVANTYGANGQRIRKVATGLAPAITTFHYARAGQLLAERIETVGTSWREYIWLDDLPLAQASTAGVAYYHVDQLNTPQKMSGGSEAMVWQASYEPFGKATVTASAGFNNPLRFPGQYFDAETGLHQNWFRDYDPSIGRYLQSDPIGLKGGVNTYTYANGNAVRLVDRLGLSAVDCAFGNAAGCRPEDIPTPTMADLCREQCRQRCRAAYEQEIERNDKEFLEQHTECEKLISLQKPYFKMDCQIGAAAVSEARNLGARRRRDRCYLGCENSYSSESNYCTK